LLAPLPTDVFFRDFWEQRYCVVTRNSSDHYAGLFTTRDVDTLLHQCRQGEAAPGRPRIRLVKRGDAPNRPAPMTKSGLLDISGVYEAYDNGYTFIVENAHARSTPIAALCHNLEAALDFGVHANLYVTPRGAQGFEPHFDTHDVFVLQLAGSKAWRVYESAETLPMPDNDRRVSSDEIGSPLGEFELERGDLLYIPRGAVHQAMTTDASSVHLTVGIHVRRWADLLCDAIMAAAERDIRLRKALPAGILGGTIEDVQTLDSHLGDLLHTCARNANCTEVLERIGPRLLQQRTPDHDGHFESLDRLSTLTTETYVRRRPGPCLVGVKNSRATITVAGSAVSGPAFLERALRFVAQARVFQVRDLPGPEWAPLSADAQVVLAKRLVRIGILDVGEL